MEHQCCLTEIPTSPLLSVERPKCSLASSTPLASLLSTMATTADEETAPLLAPEGSGNAPTSPSLSSRLSTALASPKSLNGLEKLLAALAVFLLLLTATFAGLFAGEAVKLGKEEKHHGGKHGGATVTATSTVSGPTATVTASPLPHLPGKNVSPPCCSSLNQQCVLTSG